MSDPEHVPHHVVTRLRVTGGFLSGTELELVDGLNCFIGGRGAGKTTALEFLRFGMGLMPDAKLHPRRLKAIDALVTHNLGHGRLGVELRTKSGMRYTADRAANDDVQVVDELGNPVPISLDDDLVFGADVFSQNEIEEIASSAAAQLALLDRFDEAGAQGIRRELDQIGRQLEQSAFALLRVDQEVEDLAAKAAELPALEQRLKGLAEVAGPDASRLNGAHALQLARKRETQALVVLQGSVEHAVEAMAGAAANYRAAIGSQLDASIREGANADLFGAAVTDLDAFARVLDHAVVTTTAAAEVVRRQLEAHATLVGTRHGLQEAEYRTLMAEFAESGGRFAERTALQTAYALAQSTAKELAVKQQQRADLVTARRGLLNRVSELRDQRFALRKRVAETLSQKFPTIRVRVAQSADLDAYRSMVTELLKGAGVKQGLVGDKLSQVFLPTELSEIVATNDLDALIQRTGLESDRAHKTLTALRGSHCQYALQTIDLQDRPSIELLDGATYKQSPHLSTGQRCTTILPILLLQSERPLLIDQPEDNLDNAFVYETVVKALLAVKGSRQVIFVTHNPNIPVLGQAERVFVFGSDGQTGCVTQSGTVDDCKDQIERILEGGRDAFLQRKARYGY